MDRRVRPKHVWRCEDCGRCLCSKRSYLEHKNTHNAARPFKCEYCNYAAASQMTLRRHTLRQHIPKSHWHYPCPYCDQAFVEPTSYQAHLRHKHCGYSGTFGCNLCDYRTLSSKNFADHYSSKHSDVEIPQGGVDGGRKPLNKYLIEDELGVRWSQRPSQIGGAERPSPALVDRLPEVEQRKERRRHLPETYSTGFIKQRMRLVKDGEVLIESINVDDNKRDVGTAGSWNDHEYPYAMRRFGDSARSPCTQEHMVPEAEYYVEVETSTESQEVSSSITLKYKEDDDDEDDDNRSTSSGSSDNDDNEEDSLSSISENGDLEIHSRMTALTSGIVSVERLPEWEDEGNTCQDLGNDVLPDGQVDFDLD